MGSRGEVPCQGVGDEIPNVPMREAQKQTGIGEEPKATITILLYFERISAIHAEILAYGAARMGYVRD